MSSTAVLISILVGLVSVGSAQDAVTNESVVNMVKGGLSEGIILDTVNQNSGNYAVSPNDLISLKAAGVSDAVISAMVGKMKPAPAALVTAVTPVVPATARAASTREVAFRKTKLADVKGKQADADLIFSDPKGSILVNVADGHSIAIIPYAAVDKLYYEFSKHHRIKQGAIVMVASLGAGAIVMLTKSKSHWLTIEYHEDNSPKTLVLRMDKSEYKHILKSAKMATGKDVSSQNY